MDALNKRIIYATHDLQERNAKAPIIAEIKKEIGSSSVVYDRVHKLIKLNYLYKKGREVGVSVRGLTLIEKGGVLMRETIPVVEGKKEILTGWLCPRCGAINSPQLTQCSCK